MIRSKFNCRRNSTPTRENQLIISKIYEEHHILEGGREGGRKEGGEEGGREGGRKEGGEEGGREGGRKEGGEEGGRRGGGEGEEKEGGGEKEGVPKCPK